MTISNKGRTVVASGGAQVLPEEMMIEVFLRLPIKSILRFRAVCRSWAVVLSSEEFCSLHMAKAESASSPPKLFFTSSTASFDATSVYFGSSSGPGDGLLFTLNDICGDFVDLTPAPCRGLTLVFDAVAMTYHVFNAATRAVTQLPLCQAVPFATAGLGFDSRTKSYKVVRLFQGYIQDNEHIKCEVYTLGGDCWRPAIGGVPFRFCRDAERAIHHSIQEKLLPVFANGFLHWIVDPLSAFQRPRTAILSFSVTDETFGWVQSPPFVAPDVQFVEINGHLCVTREQLVSGLHLVELAGQLCVLRDLRNAFCCSMLEVWKLNDYTSGGWSLKHRIDLLAHVARDLVEAQIVKVIGSVGDCESTGKVVIATSRRKVIVYDPMLGTLETILEMRKTHSSHQTEHSALRISLFKETLVPVHRTNEEVAWSAPVGMAAREILLRIPADHIVQLKLVCKSWLKLIENWSFIRSYSLHHNTEKRPNIMLVGKGTRGSDFRFVPLKELLQRSPNCGTWLDTKVVCSKPCHGLNLLSTETKDYLYNPCTGYRYINQTQGLFSHKPWNVPGSGFKRDQDHAFAVGKKIVGLGFNLLMQEHVIVEIFYHRKDLESHKYSWTCSISTCNYSTFQTDLLPPLPVNDMPPAYLAGMLYWMSEPRLGPSSKRAIVSYDIASDLFDCIPCPPCVASWNSKNHCPAFVVELEGRLCAVLANPVAEKLDIWKLEHGRWDRAYKIYLKGWSGYSLETNVVVPWAVDPKDGRILLNTGRKVGLYDPERRSIEALYDLDQVLRSSVRTNCTWKPPSEQLRVIDDCSPALPGNNSVGSTATQSLEEINPSYRRSMPLVPMLYKENLESYPRWSRKYFFFR